MFYMYMYVFSLDNTTWHSRNWSFHLCCYIATNKITLLFLKINMQRTLLKKKSDFALKFSRLYDSTMWNEF